VLHSNARDTLTVANARDTLTVANARDTLTVANARDTLTVAHAFVTTSRYKDTRQSMPGTLSLSVGGGQPDYYTGALSATVTVAGSATPLTQCA
jgi:hypothetical protein